ncbi:16S rRNA (guanine(966)-N(2))-methyltransferase RsmD [Thermosulfurimonas marina]|uniref:16S rRNA (Guanine(966)-N(2))-methyltransferase RsmD n=1 Tax=Thermosulfurimonas marina TaxID=2047767 RepID=A0A6H1WS25_9BACT|nr:16S rRNA (guanine(966)-N(2))-methyltransferase RsmD [Thermosulfurimonas marina]QJA05970.1 16S rRNA (guanine(966)-N(2))-methyltransferase RsmD [Thermosulfurimonas marina]
MRITGGIFRGRRLATPRGVGTRPMTERVRKALFDILGGLSGARILDLFSGSGALGLEALSRGAASVVFVEASAEALSVIRKNVQALGLEDRVQLVRGSLPQALKRIPPGPYQLVFITPPYGKGLGERTLAALPPEILAPEAIIVLEERRNSRIDPGKTPFEVQEIRKYGDTSLYFLKVREESREWPRSPR